MPPRANSVEGWTEAKKSLQRIRTFRWYRFWLWPRLFSIWRAQGANRPNDYFAVCEHAKVDWLFAQYHLQEELPPSQIPTGDGIYPTVLPPDFLTPTHVALDKLMKEKENAAKS
jgi:hypothetical protein